MSVTQGAAGLKHLPSFGMMGLDECQLHDGPLGTGGLTMYVRAFFLLITFVVPAFALKPMTVAQLEQITSELLEKRDSEVAARLADIRLTERLSRRKLLNLEATMPGRKSRDALLILADESAFLAPPSREIMPKLVPKSEEQRRIMALVVSYVTRTIPKLPDFLATRTTARFEDQPVRFVQSPQSGSDSTNFYEPLHRVGSATNQVSYESGREKIGDGTNAAAGGRGLRTWGEFGPILSTILLDAAQSKLEWLHWELDGSKSLAVFTYAVPKEKSHFEINYCCVADSEGRTREFRELVGYSGEMAVDPTTGTILRLELVAALKPGEPVTKAGLVVEYGNVEIAGRIYTCPIHSIALSRGQSLSKEKQEIVQSAAHGQSGFGIAAVVVGTTPEVVEQSLLNDSVYSQYHVFRSEMRIIAGTPSNQPVEGGAPEVQSPAARPARDNEGAPGLETIPFPERMSSLDSAVIAGEVVPSGSANPAALAVTEISSRATTSLPDLPAQQESVPSSPGFTLRTTSRLVDVSVVALDKEGHPITDLRRDDFEIYDNGRKQSVSFFSQAETAPPNTLDPAIPTPAARDAYGIGFSNQDPTYIGTAGTRMNRASTTILMIDAANLAFADLTYARSEMLRFLKTVPEDELVGLYVLRKYGFQVLKEPITNHVELAAILTKWMPDAQDLAQAQHEERRNRQQIDYVHNIADLLYVNGNVSSGAGDIFASPDPQLQSLGDHPARDALAFLTWVARHLAALPGHKSLIWVSSDNVLADFNDKGPSLERGDKYIDSPAMRAREALNEAHVSIYPLDASQLEPGGVGANLRHGNVQLSPTSNPEVQLLQLPTELREQAKEALNKSERDINPGRVAAQMQQDAHLIQSTFRELAEATGGRPLRRAGEIAAELDSIVADGSAAYMLGFTPDTSPDDTYHHITVKLPNRHNITLRNRTGYLYSKEPATLKERFQRAVWQATDVGEIALKGFPARDSNAPVLKLKIVATDLGLSEQDGFWTDKLDIFMIQRDDAALRTTTTGKTLALRLRAATYRRILNEGIDVDEPIQQVPDTGTLRILVIDHNTGRMGTLTIPVSALR